MSTAHALTPATAEVQRIVALVTNSISIAMALAVIVTYGFLWRLFPRLLSRTSLKLSATVAAADIVFAIANVASYGELPNGFVCAFVGGELFATGSLLSMFYTCAIVLNSQLVLVYNRPPNATQQSYLLTVPLALALLITFPSLAAGMYGYDQKFNYCWYDTEGLDKTTLMLRVLFSYDIWIFLAVPYLLFASYTIVIKVFGQKPHVPQISSPIVSRHGIGYTGPGAGTSSVLEQDDQMRAAEDSEHLAVIKRRDKARKALTLRLLGSVFVPILCFIPVIVLDLINKLGGRVSPSVNIGFVAVQGLLGTLNALLFVRDPTIVAISQNMEAANPPPNQTSTVVSTHSYKHQPSIKRDKHGYPLPMNINNNQMMDQTHGGSFLPMSKLTMSGGSVVSEGDGMDAAGPGHQRSESRMGMAKGYFNKWKKEPAQAEIMISVEVSRHTDAVNVLNGVGDDLQGL